MKGSIVTATLVMARRAADWLGSRDHQPSLGIDAAVIDTELQGEGVCKLCGETRITERVYQFGSVTYTMTHFACKHPRAEKL
jgi:hypothetical protein